ncbi:MAG TPA: phosphoribosylamine--glycine ligase [Atribacteraceae bacterium]|nr:phosphoribosylamine--glycine ligase [Atribacteraceae bacterium]
MKALVIGNGGREHCLCWKLSQNSRIDRLYCSPGNGGTALLGTNVPLATPREYLQFAKEQIIDLTIIGPEAYLAEGIVDLFLSEKLPVIGPNRAAARLESSKIFAKQFMNRNHIPTADYEIFDQSTEAFRYLGSNYRYPLVLKADGLAAGKGVAIAQDSDEARIIMKEFMLERRLGAAGERMVVEEFLSGEEATVMMALDGRTYRMFPFSQDHKRIGEGDIGPNTGGMGAYSPTPVVDKDVQVRLEREIIGPLMEGLAREKLFYRGFLYLGLMIDEMRRPRVLEFNVRLGDPEAQVILPRLQTDWLELCLAIWEGKLSETILAESAGANLAVVLATHGYPGHYDTGMVIDGLEQFENRPDDEVLVFHAGTKRQENKTITTSGRVMNVCGRGKDLLEAKDRAYQAISQIRFDKMYYRRDIGYRAWSQRP